MRTVVRKVGVTRRQRIFFFNGRNPLHFAFLLFKKFLMDDEGVTVRCCCVTQTPCFCCFSEEIRHDTESFFFFVSFQKSDIIEEHSNVQPLLVDRPESRSSSFTYNRFLSGCNERQFEEAHLRSPLTASCR